MQIRKIIAEVVSKLCMNHGTQADESLIELWAFALNNLSNEEIKKGMFLALTEWKGYKMPSTAQFISLCKGNKIDLIGEAMLAWHDLETAIKRYGAYSSIYFENKNIAKFVELNGGWAHICGTWLEDEMKWKKKDFLAEYPAIKTLENKENIVLGISDSKNMKLILKGDAKPQIEFVGAEKDKKKIELFIEEKKKTNQNQKKLAILLS